MTTPSPALDPAAIPLALYLHVPWCVRKCPYCDFNSHGLRGEIPEDDYVDAVLRDLAFELERPELRPVTSIFIGGGTPSLFSGRAIARMLDGCAARLRFAADIEITLEANPGTVDAGHFRDYRAAGVNRLSIGVQSLDDAMLRRLGRIHGRREVETTVDTARQAGFDNLNLDLMYALPEQTPAGAAADLDAALALAPEHLSLYQLTLEPNTEFAARPPPLPDDDSAWAMQEAAQQRLAAAGFHPYEVSAYAREGRQCRHNRTYWTFGDYLGLGAGAHGKRTFADGIERRARHKLPKTYLGTAGGVGVVQEQRWISAAERPFEFLMNALRVDEGFTDRAFERGTGLPAATLSDRLQAQVERGLLVCVGSADDRRHRTTPLGRAHLNTLLTAFL